VTDYFTYLLERIHLQRDVHFYTNTTIDTLDYSGDGLNTGSKVVLAAYGNVIRSLAKEVPSCIANIAPAQIAIPGVVALQMPSWQNYTAAKEDIKKLQLQLQYEDLQNLPVIVICDDAKFVAATLNNFVWITFTRCNPSHDMYGINETLVNKHWGCSTLIIDARIKKHHAPALPARPMAK
jgi:4-hydroxy-3-polyprenylbenzoate decarboxylase